MMMYTFSAHSQVNVLYYKVIQILIYREFFEWYRWASVYLGDILIGFVKAKILPVEITSFYILHRDIFLVKGNI